MHSAGRPMARRGRLCRLKAEGATALLWEEWLAWYIVRDRERELERRRLQKEAESARSDRTPRAGSRATCDQPAPRRRAA